MFKSNFKNNSNILLIIEKFQPLIKKYSKRLFYEEAESDLTIFLLELIKKIPNTENERVITSYIAKSIKNEFIRLNKKQELISQKEVATELDKLKYISENNIDLDIKIDIKNALKSLSQKQREVIEYRILLDYSYSKTASTLNISRQAVFKTQKKALNILKDKLQKVYYSS